MSRTQNARSRSSAEAARSRALIYIRKSIVRSGADQISPERQRANCLDEAQRHGWLVEEGDIYVDAEGHQSGRDDSRIAWQRLRRRVREDPSVAAVIVESLSRASRSVRSFYAFVDELRAEGVALISLKEHFDTTGAIGQAMLGFVAIVNQLESDLASERMRANIAFKKTGGRHWGRTPFGCRRLPDTGALAPSDETYTLDGADRRYHDALRRCYALYAEGETGFKGLGIALNAEGWRFRGLGGAPRRWDAHNTRSVLMLHRVYAGWVPATGHNKDKATHESATPWVQANYDPILPPELCDRVGAVLARRSVAWRHAPVPGQRYVHDYTLTGVLYCHACGRRLHGNRGADGRRHYRHQARGNCPQRWFDGDALEAGALALLDALVPPAAAVAGLRAVLEAVGVANEDVLAERDEVDRAIRRLEGEIDRLVDLAVDVTLEAGAYRRALEARGAELAVLQRRRADLSRQTAETRRDLDRVMERLQNAQGLLRGAPANVQKHLLRSVFERLEAAGSEIVAWRPRDWCRPFF